MSELTAVAGALPAEPGALITIAPETYVAAVFAPYKTELEQAVAVSANVTFDITTTAGMKTATEWRAVFRTLRTGAEKTRAERKAPILKIGKLLDSSYKELEAAIRPHEERFDALITAEETRKETEKQARIEAELARVDAIQKKIATIRSLPGLAAGASPHMIQGVIERLNGFVIDDSYEEFLPHATEAKAESLQSLQAALAAAEQAEADRRELEELRREKAARQAASAPAPVEPLRQSEIVVKVAAEAINKARTTAKAPPPFIEDPDTEEVATATAPGPVSTVEALFNALLACHACLTGRQTDMASAIQQAELALLAAGANPEQLGLTR